MMDYPYYCNMRQKRRLSHVLVVISVLINEPLEPEPFSFCFFIYKNNLKTTCFPSVIN